MRLISVFALVFFVIIAWSCRNSDSNAEAPGKKFFSGSDVVWRDYSEGIKLARSQDKPVVIDFFAEWCKWCKVMDKETFSDPEISDKLSRDYIAIRIHTDQNPDEKINFKNHTLTKQDLAMMLGVQGLPTVVFMDKEENLITKVPGFIKKDMFLSMLGYMKDECYKKNVSFEDYRGGRTGCNSSGK
jgi:thioredoxin-related protein